MNAQANQQHTSQLPKYGNDRSGITEWMTENENDIDDDDDVDNFPSSETMAITTRTRAFQLAA